MPRPRSHLTHEAKRRLLQRLGDGSLRPGDRFYSNRAVARMCGISYQTAHRLLDELVNEGHLQRSPSSGTYVAGMLAMMEGVELCFHPRARRTGSFGARLLEVLKGQFEADAVPVRVRFGERVKPATRLYPIVWECAGAFEAIVAAGRYGLLLHQQAPPGLAASYLDSISIDDYSGGVAAGEWLALRGRFRRVRVLAGPYGDTRSRRRVEGFLTVHPRAQVVWADAWYFEDGLRAAAQVADADAVFCGNDRLAEAVIVHARQQLRAVPELIGFDDAPVAAELGISTVAIPWEEMARAATRIANRRLAGEPHPASRMVISPRPVSR